MTTNEDKDERNLEEFGKITEEDLKEAFENWINFPSEKRKIPAALYDAYEAGYNHTQDKLQKQRELLDEMAEALRAYKNDFDGDAYNVLRETQSTELLAKYQTLKDHEQR